MPESYPRFLWTSYVREQPQGPLFITAVEEDTVRIVSVLYGTERVRLRLAEGEALDDVVATLKALQHNVVSIPIAKLKKIVWNDCLSDVVFIHDVGNRTKRTSASIRADEDRKQLLLAVRHAVNGPVQCFDEPAGVLAVAWSQIAGGVMTVAGTIVFMMLWDPAALGRVRGGAIALLLGRTGCALVGVGIFLCCCVSAWLAIRKRSRYYTCVFNESD